MKVLVTGTNGFLGHATVEVLECAGHEVIATARNSSESQIACDLADSRSLLKMLDSVVPEAVVNCAATVNFGKSCFASLYAVNVLMPGIVAQWCRARGAYLCQVSGTLVHGTRMSKITSTSPINADTDYGQSKWLAEQLIEASGAAASRVRFGGIFGRDGPDHLGLNRAIRAAAGGQSPVVVGEGKAQRNYIHVADAAQVLLQCVEQQICGVRWAGGGEVLSINQMMQQICDIYLPSESPKFAECAEASNQIVESSPDLVTRHRFREALANDP